MRVEGRARCWGVDEVVCRGGRGGWEAGSEVREEGRGGGAHPKCEPVCPHVDCSTYLAPLFHLWRKSPLPLRRWWEG